MNRLKIGIVIAAVCTLMLLLTASPLWLMACILSGGYVGITKARIDTGAMEA